MTFRGNRIVIRTLVPLGGDNPDDHPGGGGLDLARDVSISYIDLMEHTSVRRQDLLRR